MLEGHELSVTELATVFRLPQSTMSRHLKVLTEEGWLGVRAEGVTRWYSMRNRSLDAPRMAIWEAVRPEVSHLPVVSEDRVRLEMVLDSRRRRSREFFAGAAAEWDRIRSELIGTRSDVLGLLALLDAGWTVGDFGCGTGQMTEVIAPFVERVIAVDESESMLEAARSRLARVENVEIRPGELERLPIEDGRLDAAVIMLTLPYVAEPGAVIAEAARALVGGGRLVITDLTRHDREDYRERFGHQALGFTAEQIHGWMTAAGLTAIRYVPIPPEPDAEGPPLFAASGLKPFGRSMDDPGESRLETGLKVV